MGSTSTDAVVVIHGNYRSGNQSSYLREAMEAFTQHAPAVYSIEHQSPIFMPTNRHMFNYASSLSHTISYIIRELNIQKISLLAIGQATQILLYYLSMSNVELFDYLDKIMLINCHFESFRFAHSHSGESYELMLNRLAKPQVAVRMNRLRIISIQSRKINRMSKIGSHQLIFRDERASWLHFSNYISIQSRFMWNIYLEMSNSELLEMFPFVNLLAQFFVLDSKYRMNMKNIEYFLKWREHPNPQPNSKHKEQFTLRCPQFLFELDRQDDYVDDRKCKHLKFRGGQSGNSLVIEGHQELEVYTEKYIKLQPISNTSKLIYYLRNLESLPGVYILNKQKQSYILMVTRVRRIPYSEVDKDVFEGQLLHQRVVQLPDVPVKICTNTALIFPFVSSGCSSIVNGLIIQENRSSSLMIFDTGTPYDYYWPLHRNLIVCGLFTFNVISSSLISLLFFQLTINLIILYHHSYLFVVLTTLYTFSIAYIFTRVLSCLKWFLNKFFQMEFDKQMMIILSPLILIFKKFVRVSLQVTEWYAILLAMMTICRKKDSMLCCLLFYLNFDYISRNQSCLERFFVMEASLICVMYVQEYLIMQRHRKTLDMFFVVMLHLFCEEEISDIQALLQIYTISLCIISILSGLRQIRRKDIQS